MPGRCMRTIHFRIPPPSVRRPQLGDHRPGARSCGRFSLPGQPSRKSRHARALGPKARFNKPSRQRPLKQDTTSTFTALLSPEESTARFGAAFEKIGFDALSSSLKTLFRRDPLRLTESCASAARSCSAREHAI
jgi:hypothetical protein